MPLHLCQQGSEAAGIYMRLLFEKSLWPEFVCAHTLTVSLKTATQPCGVIIV